MRVVGLSNIQAAIRANVAELIGRLETGDVIKAKVLEISSGEAMLRLFDGSVLKAALGGDLQAEVGQTLTLSVTSKSEGTLFLETVKGQSQMNTIKPDILINLLSALNLKANSRNTELASEFLKAGITPTFEQFETATSMMKDLKGLNAEKAVFLTSRGIQPDQAKLELLSKLLDGNLKLGNQLNDLQSILESISKLSGKPVPTNSALNTFLDAATAALAEKAAANTWISAQNSNTAQTSATAVKTQQLQQQLQGAATSQNNSATFAGQGDANNNTNAAAELLKNAGGVKGIINATISNKDLSGTTGNINAGTSNTSGILTAAGNTTTSAQNRNPVENAAGANAIVNNTVNSSQTTSSQQSSFSGTAAAQEAVTAAKEFVSKTGIMQSITDDINSSGKTGTASSDPLTSIKDAIKDVFVQLDSDKSAESLDLSKSHKELGDKLDMLKNTIQNSGLTGLSGGESIAAATNQIDDSMKLLNQLNNNNVYYYQIPVNLTGQNTTAELYVMKRDQGKKRIDPNNSVMFISLDTDNLGRFESLIDVKGKNVTINFRTEKQEINDFIKENIKYLYSGLSDIGYKLADIRYALIDAATPPLKLEQVLSKMVESSRTKVDMRI